MPVPDTRWNHNIHYHPIIVRALGPARRRVLDVGCGEGVLAHELARRGHHVTGIDLHAASVENARNDGPHAPIDFIVGDVLTHPFTPGSFDAIVSVATIHHIGTGPALRRIGELLRPGGIAAIVGLARSRSPADLAYDVAGAVSTRIHTLRKPCWETSAPKVWPPPESFAEVRRTAARITPGARFRRHLLWRYSLVWQKGDRDIPRKELPNAAR
ncbi:MAG: class I SAM-dependent methyltransferase [Acidimicrobiia bacterium]|nr:class I SAM-dependent methyltransferase [Acidimicrobiia bacterium]